MFNKTVKGFNALQDGMREVLTAHQRFCAAFQCRPASRMACGLQGHGRQRTTDYDAFLSCELVVAIQVSVCQILALLPNLQIAIFPHDAADL